MVEMMVGDVGEIQKILADLKMIASARQSTETFSKVYDSLAEEGEQFHPDEAIATITFARHGVVNIDHLRWSDLVNLNQIYRELCQREHMLSSQVNQSREQCDHRSTGTTKVDLVNSICDPTPVN